MVLHWCDVLKLYTVRSGMFRESKMEILVKVVRCWSCSYVIRTEYSVCSMLILLVSGITRYHKPGEPKVDKRRLGKTRVDAVVPSFPRNHDVRWMRLLMSSYFYRHFDWPRKGGDHVISTPVWFRG